MSCPCPCHKPETKHLPSEFKPCCPRMGQKFIVLPEPEPGVEEGFAGDDICIACDGMGEIDGRICKSCGGKVYR